MAVLRLVPSQGAPVPLEISKDRVVVGREATCDVVVSDGSVSRKHAIVERRGTGWAVVDQGSANGTFVDGQRVTDVAVHTGQELRFGSMAYRVEVEGDDESATILTTSPDATVIQDAPVKRPAAPPAPAVKPAAPPWSAPPHAPVVTPAPLLPREPVPAPPPLPPRPAAPPVPPRASAPPPPASAPPPLPPRTAASRPPGVTSVSDGAPPMKKKRGPLFWAGGGCCGCLVLLLVFFGVIGGGAYFMTSAAVDAVKTQIAEVKKGDMAAAYGLMSEEYRSRHSMEDFVAFVDRHPALKQNTDTTFMNRSVKNDTATISGSLSGANATKEDVTYNLVKEGGAWKINEIQFGDEASDAGGNSTAMPAGPTGGAAAAAAGGSGGSLRLETVSADKSEDPPGYVIAIKLRATGFGTEGPADAPRADLVLDLETLGPGGARLPDLSRMELQSRNHPDTLAPPSVDFDVSVTLREAAPGNYVARLTVRDQIGRDIKSQDVPFTLP